MQVQTVFRAGNSNVVAIPKAISDDLNFKKGSEVIVQKLPQGDAFIVKKAVRDERVKKTSLDTETKKKGNKRKRYEFFFFFKKNFFFFLKFLFFKKKKGESRRFYGLGL